jgi:hypothetical protein
VSLESVSDNLEVVLNNESMYSDGKIIGGNITDRALLSFFENKDINDNVIKRIPFDSKNKYSKVELESGYRLIKGATEKVLPMCNYYYDDAMNRKFLTNRKKIVDKINEISKKGIRVLCFGVSFNNDIYALLGFVYIKDEIRKEAIEGIKLVKDAGIRTIMITGDNKDTAYAIGSELGLIENEDIVLTSDELNKMNDVDLWYEVKEDLLQIHYQSIDESMLAVSQQYFVCVGVSRSLLESINDIDIVKHDIYDYAETTYNVDEYNNIHLYKYSYFPTNIDILPSEKVLINSHDDLSKYLNTLYSNNYALDYFEKGIVLAYVISVPDNYTVGNPIYKVEKDVLKIQVSYLELDYAADNVESFIIIIDSYKENLINIQTIELEMIHYE